VYTSSFTDNVENQDFSRLRENILHFLVVILIVFFCSDSFFPFLIEFFLGDLFPVMATVFALVSSVAGDAFLHIAPSVKTLAFLALVINPRRIGQDIRPWRAICTATKGDKAYNNQYLFHDDNVWPLPFQNQSEAAVLK
jgi:hypothetical protein